MNNLLKILIGVNVCLLFILAFNIKRTKENKEISVEYLENDIIYDYRVKDTAYVKILPPVDTTSLTIDNNYTIYVLNDFVDDAYCLGLDTAKVIEHIKRLDGIYVDSIQKYEMLGITEYRSDTTTSKGIRGRIFLDHNLFIDYNLYKFVLYHELGHWFGLEHCKEKDEIMMDEYRFEEISKIRKKWDKKVKRLMKDINNKYSNESFDFPDIEEDIKYVKCSHKH